MLEQIWMDRFEEVKESCGCCRPCDCGSMEFCDNKKSKNQLCEDFSCPIKGWRNQAAAFCTWHHGGAGFSCGNEENGRGICSKMECPLT